MKQILKLLTVTLSTALFAQEEWNGTTTGQITYTGGNVGIGTTIPAEKLDVTGKIQSDYLRLKPLTAQEGGEMQLMGPTGYNDWRVDNRLGALRFHHSGHLHFHMNSNGDLGLGTYSPHAKLHVVGQLRGIQGGSGNIIGIYLSNDNSTNNNSNSIYFGSIDTNGERDNGAVIRTIFTEHSATGVTGNLVFETADNAENPVERLRIDGTGKVGIGTSIPSEKLEVAGKIRADYLRIDSENPSGVEGGEIMLDGANGFNNWIIDNYKGKFRLHHSGANQLTVHANGQVGIGTGNSALGTHKLAVEGSIGAREVKVEADGWSDFVFEKDYDLRTLAEVEQYINEKGHLPEIASAAEVIDHGINLGEMDAKLLQKIEELTLYTIEQEKRLNNQGSEIEELRTDNLELRMENKKWEDRYLELLKRIEKLESK